MPWICGSTAARPQNGVPAKQASKTVLTLSRGVRINLKGHCQPKLSTEALLPLDPHKCQFVDPGSFAGTDGRKCAWHKSGSAWPPMQKILGGETSLSSNLFTPGPYAGRRSLTQTTSMSGLQWDFRADYLRRLPISRVRLDRVVMTPSMTLHGLLKLK